MNIIRRIKQTLSHCNFSINPDRDTVVFDFGDFDITKREIIGSVIIIVFWFILGFLISEKITEEISDKQKEYNQALQIDSRQLFEYGMQTNVGNAFVFGTLKAFDPVSFSEIGGQYLNVEKTLEIYTRHEIEVEHTDSDGNKYYTTEVYYSWDEEDWESKHSNKITFLDVEFDYSKIKYSNMQYIDTIYETSDSRWVYYGTPPECSGTIYTNLCDGTISNTKLHPNMDIEETLQSYNRNYGDVSFKFLWFVLLILGLYGFYYLDNEWLA